MNSSCEPDNACHLLPFPILWKRQVESTPNAVAVVSELGQWTYEELDHKAEVIAVSLIRQGVHRGKCVGLCLDRSYEAIASMIGVMKAGAAFVPLDPEYPPDRLQYMLRNAEIDCVIGAPAYREIFDSSSDQTEKSLSLCWLNPFNIHSESTNVGAHAAGRQSDSNSTAIMSGIELRGEDIAYVMYTSGSTGKPKGVVISHRALTTYCLADIECYNITTSDRTLQFSTLNFDIAIEEIFPPLLTGSCVIVRPNYREDTANELSAIIDRFSVTAVHLATAYWHSWVDLMLAMGTPVPRSLRLMVVTGEKVSIEHYRRWQSLCDHDVLWCNAYGPTEATVTATVFIPDDTFDSPECPATNMPIGRPLPRYEAYVLDEQMMEVSEGETGQLYLAGPALAEGYLHRSDLTETAFINIAINGQSHRLYKTGDLARWLPDGNLDFGGRIDHQIKLGSYRVEPAEIEGVINSYAGINESLIQYDEVDGQKFLIAYVAIGKQAEGLNSLDKQTMLAADLAAHLRKTLPEYMIPTRYIFIDQFPKTINGKIDRDALPDPDFACVASDSHYEAPQNDRQRYLAGLWQEVLNVPQIGIHDDFFFLGGSSLLVPRVVAKVATDLEIVLPVRDFFANPTVATLSNHLDALLSGNQLVYRYDDKLLEPILDRLPIAKPTFIESAAGRLYSVHYQPRSVRKDHAILFAHSLGHEYVRGHRNFQQLAVALCGRGFDVIRFDYLGTGDSDGLSEEVNAQTMIRNLVDVRQHIIDHTGIMRISLVGLRLGATVATHLRDAFQCMVLWDPVPSGKSFLELLDRFHHHALTSGMRFNRIRTDTGENQRYGYRMNESKRASFAELRINTSIQECDIVLSKDEFAPVFDTLATSNRIHRVTDEILWENPLYAESAFSSPEAFKIIINLFDEMKS